MTDRERLPQLGGELFLTDGGIETTLIFHQGLELPEFAAFVLLDDEEGTSSCAATTTPYLELAARARHRLRARVADLAREPEVGGPSSATPTSSSTASIARRSR